MTFGGDVLTGILGNAAWDIVKNLALKILGPGKDTYEQDDMVNKAYFALEDAAKRFFDKYGKSFGPKHDCFLAREANIETLLRRIRLDCPKIEVKNLDPEGFQGAPKATTEALEFLIAVFEEELKKDRQLADLVEISRHHEKLDDVAMDVKEIKERIRPPD
jgi:hypothetical protein